jgi:D-tyrosyl-tRNA(Tyr) deacylase
LKFVIQRVLRASVRVDGKVEAEIARGLLVLVGIARGDGAAEAAYMAEKLVNLRIFNDAEEKMNLSALDVGASLLLVSQFTLYGDCRKGRRPSFDTAAPPDEARKMYEEVVQAVRGKGLATQSGVFQAHMEVELVNDGPVTLIVESL